LERARLVERRPDLNDRRGRQIALTAAGKRAIDDLIGPMVALEARLIPVLTPEEQKTLNALLKKLLAGLQIGDPDRDPGPRPAAARPSASPPGR
jgi:DNA-binding MarR family transcriptional regulator